MLSIQRMKDNDDVLFLVFNPGVRSHKSELHELKKEGC